MTGNKSREFVDISQEMRNNPIHDCRYIWGIVEEQGHSSTSPEKEGSRRSAPCLTQRKKLPVSKRKKQVEYADNTIFLGDSSDRQFPDLNFYALLEQLAAYRHLPASIPIDQVQRSDCLQFPLHS